MTPSSSSDVEPVDFVSIVTRHAMMSTKDARGIVEDAARHGTSATLLALQRGMIDGIQADVVETLLHPRDAIPGYRIDDLVGVGGMGVVYRARQLNLDRTVALKTVLVSQLTQSNVLERFEQEAMAVGRLRHPNIIAAFDFGRSNGRYYFAMEFLTGEDLERHLERHGKLDEAKAWGIARQVASGLAHAAQQGIVHRDIKPANLLLTSPPEGFPLPEGTPMVKITDFGLALLTNDSNRTRLTKTGSALGTPAYLAPEQLTSSNIDHRADIYSLGATLYHMLGAAPPYSGSSVMEIVSAKIKGGDLDLKRGAPWVSDASARLVMSMLAWNADDRPQSYTNLLRMIDHLFDETGTQISPSPRLSGPTIPVASGTIVRKSRRTWLKAIAFGVIGVGVGVGAGFNGWNHLLRWTYPRRPRPAKEVGDKYLFLGDRLDGWRTVSGTWRVAQNPLGIFITGQGTVERSLPIPRDHGPASFRVGLKTILQRASAVEFECGFAGTEENALRLVLRLSREGASFGRRTSDDGPLRGPVLTSSIALDPSDVAEHFLQVERQDGFWFAFVGDVCLGGLPATGADEVPLIRLSAEKEDALFGDVQMFLLEPVSTP